MKTLLALIALFLAACSTTANTQIKLEDSSYSASVGIVNHTSKFIYSASVNGAGGANMDAWGAGIGEVCCATVPKTWHSGMKVIVRWDMPEGSKHVVKEKTVEVERYDEPGSIYLHFFPDDQVRVVVSQYYGWSSKHPIPRPVKPGSQSAQSN